MTYIKICKRFNYKKTKLIRNILLWFLFGFFILIYLELIDYI